MTPESQAAIRRDCRHFPGDRPCDYHKKGLASCPTCRFFSPKGHTVLIIKFDALGDVLRTTALLPSLAATYGNCYVTWITSAEAEELFIGNPMVQEVMTSPADYLPVVINREFDTVINPDATPRSCELASMASGRRKCGFVADPSGGIVPLSRMAMRWLEMGGSDEVKKANTMTYQQILHEICGISPGGQHIVLNLTREEVGERGALASSIGISGTVPVIGINTGAGGRWPLKKWRPAGFIQLIQAILQATDAEVVLLGGPREEETNIHIRGRFDERVYRHTSASLREFVRLIDLCDIVVTGDTLALHGAVGLKKRVVALFGPTSAAEIDLYGLGTKIVPRIECVCCYSAECTRAPNCMDLISATEVFAAVMGQLKELGIGGVDENWCESTEREYTMVGERSR
jgi:ADP-heptose:LPS heptosyltransferase